MSEYMASEHWRRTCEARALIRMYSTGELRAAYLERVAKKRGQSAADMLRADLIAELHARKHGGMLPPYCKSIRMDNDSTEWAHDYGHADNRSKRAA